MIEDFVSLFIDKNKFIGNGNLFPDIDLLIDKWNNLISNLSIEQLGAFAHLLSALTIFFLFIYNYIYSLFRFFIKIFKNRRKIS